MEVIDDDKPLYNSRIIDTYVKFIKSTYPFVNVGELLESAGMHPYQVDDHGHWFTQAQVNAFHERASRMTGNPNLSREAGRYAASPEDNGGMRQYIMGMVGPAMVYELINKASSVFTRSAVYASRRISTNMVEITVTPRPGVQERQFQCDNRTGIFEAIGMVFQKRMPRIDHPECIFKGGEVCRYLVSWENATLPTWEKGRTLLLGLTALTAGLALFFDPMAALRSFPGISAATALLYVVFKLKREKQGLIDRLDTFQDSSDKLLDQINLNYNIARVTNEIGQAISRQNNVDDILASVVQVLEERLDYDRGLILLANQSRSKLVFRAGFGYPEATVQALTKTTFHLNRPESQGVFVISMREQKPFLVNNINELDGSLSLRSLEFARKLGSQSFICCPIICEGESVGILAVDNLKSKRPLLQSDMSLLMGIAPVIGISIHNANLLDAKFAQFSSFLKVLAASIDARDPLTAGHSEKVTEYSVEICHELGLPPAEVEMIRVAALLHDYGKIGVPDAILKKNGKLTDLEYEIVKTHSYKTRDILDQVNFEGIYKQVPEIAGAHHEKVDGTGYPRGLKGKDIPLGAKIIAVADFYEAVTSLRHYREPMLVEDAFRLLREGIGSHFEKKVVEALISCRLRARAAANDEIQELQESGLRPRQEMIGV
ncbi:histidine kinase [Geomonas silvestris]|uniref:Histidine kinase n=1 Tax=Geomonas silvestris TaxID=2740184 RepID=A0A6V8MJD2_9BACT|nr:HD domain-containing phosphohydrolase [Geomonas silvestris]GFO59913.1 histidine kinase [Geomonas silvestris]